jgi:putative peptidoglycan lipid II flippase
MKMTTPLIIGSVLVTFNVFVDRMMASRIGTGYIAALHYGYIPLTFILSFFTVGLSTSILPYLSDHVVKNNIHKIKRLFSQAIRLIFFITLPAVVLCLFLANPFIELLLERGAFTSDNTSSVALVLRFYALGLPFAAINATIIRFFHALQKNNILMYISIPYVGLNIVLNWILIHPLGHGGIALSTAIDYLLVVSVLYIILNRILGSLMEKQDIVVIVKTITATILMALSLFVYTEIVQEAHIISRLIQPCVLAVTVYVTTSVLMKHQDFHYLKGAVTKIFQRNATR